MMSLKADASPRTRDWTWTLSLTRARPAIHPVAAWGLAFALCVASARGQTAVAPAATSPRDAQSMRAFTQTIPGSDVQFEMLPIPGGTFEMGSPADEPKRADDEGPVHKVELAPFWMGKCEVTWDEYDIYAFARDLKKKEELKVDRAAQPAGEKRADAVSRPTKPYADPTFGMGRSGQPVICITHHAAMEYCRWLSEKTGRLYRLPTEAEWEYACRAGTKTAYSFGDVGSIDAYAWYVENSEKPQLVGKKKPNPWGLHDMHGNVAEWCLDHYSPDVYAKLAALGTAKQPVLIPDAKEYPYVARGGSWDDDADKLRSAARRASNLEWSVQDPQRPQSIWWHTDATFVGFRVVSPLVEQENLRGLKSPVVKFKADH